MDLISLLEEKTRLSVVLKLIKAIENKKYEGTKEERIGVYTTPECLNIFDVLESRNLPYGYRGTNENGEVWELDFFEGNKFNMLKVKGVFSGEQLDLSEFLEMDPSRLNMRWTSNNTRVIKTVGDKCWTDTDSDIEGELVLTEELEMVIVDHVSSGYTYWGQDIKLPKIIKVIESKGI